MSDLIAEIEFEAVNSEIDRHLAGRIIAALPAVQPRVKPLVWKEFGTDCLRAESVLGIYEIVWGFHNGQATLDVPALQRTLTWHPNLEAAKAAAQTHLEMIIHPALEPQPDAAAIREIAEGLLSLGDNLAYIAAATEAHLHSEAYALRASVLALIDNTGKEVRGRICGLPICECGMMGPCKAPKPGKEVQSQREPARPASWPSSALKEAIDSAEQTFPYLDQPGNQAVAGAARVHLDVTCECGKSRPCYPADKCRWPVKAHNAVAGAAKFALDRIREWESDNLTDGTERDWHGHVGPALARLASTLVAQPEPVAEPVTGAVRDVLAERQRQISEEGWTPEHDDDAGRPGDLANAAACYAMTDPVMDPDRRRLEGPRPRSGRARRRGADERTERGAGQGKEGTRQWLTAVSPIRLS